MTKQRCVITHQFCDNTIYTVAQHVKEECCASGLGRNGARGNANMWSATMTTTLLSPLMGGEMSTNSAIASDVGQQATESNNHPKRVGNYREEEVGQKGG